MRGRIDAFLALRGIGKELSRPSAAARLISAASGRSFPCAMKAREADVAPDKRRQPNLFGHNVVFVYWIEDHPRYAKLVRQLLLEMEERQDQLCTGSFAVGEALVRPRKAGDRGGVATKMLNVFSLVRSGVVPFGLEAAEHYASIRTSQIGFRPRCHSSSLRRAGTHGCSS